MATEKMAIEAKPKVQSALPIGIVVAQISHIPIDREAKDWGLRVTIVMMPQDKSTLPSEIDKVPVRFAALSDYKPELVG